MTGPPPERHRPLRRPGALIEQVGYLAVVTLLLASVVSALLIGASELGALVSLALGGTALLATVFQSTTSRGARGATLAFVILVALAAVLRPDAGSAGGHRIGALATIGYVAVVGAALPLVVVRSFQHRRVTLNTLCAAVSAYLLLGMLFSGLFRLLDEVSPPFFAEEPPGRVCDLDPVPPDCPTPGQFSYFSFITLSTVGYGDLTPASDPARALVTLEAITGQVFVVTILARVVSLLGEDRPAMRRLRTDDADDS